MQMQPCNCTSSRSALSKLDAVMSTADSICFSLLSFFFFFPSQDLISIPTQSFRILSSYLLSLSFLLPSLFLLLLLHQPVSSGPSRSDGTDSKEADVTAKQLNDREEASCVVSPFPSSPLLKFATIYSQFPHSPNLNYPCITPSICDMSKLFSHVHNSVL